LTKRKKLFKRIKASGILTISQRSRMKVPIAAVLAVSVSNLKMKTKIMGVLETLMTLKRLNPQWR